MRTLFFAASCVVLSACGSCTGTVGGDDGGADAGPAVIDAGPYAYDARPANPTCVAPPPPPSSSPVTTQRVFTNLTFSQPLGLFNAPNAPDRVYVLERLGTLRHFPNRQDAGTPEVQLALDISANVDASGEGGLLGMAFHPDWPARAELYLNYTETGSGGRPLRSVISRFKSTDQGLTFDPGSEERLLELDQPYTNHDGGNLAFGPDGYLYIGFGDGGSGGDPTNAGQRLNTNLGKFLRIDVDVPFAQKYGIPPTNPFAADATPCNRTSAALDAPAGTRCAEIYAWGFRNPWRWSFDLDSGELWAGDVGQGAREEVDRVVLGGNYGWKVREGFSCYSPMTNCPTAGLIDPVVDYPRADGNSITGGFTYRGATIPTLRGRFVFGDYGSGRIWALTADGQGGYTSTQLVDTSFALASFGQLLDGEIYALDIGSGRIHQLVPMGTPPADTFPRLLSQTGCFEPSDPTRPVAALVPYELNAALWSDGAEKLRAFAVPDGATLGVSADAGTPGHFDFPVGSVLSKTFLLEGRRVETRLFMRHPDGTWGGYSYEWNDAQTDATLLAGSKTRQVGARTWYYPSRGQCMQCHTAAAGFTLGPEVAQLNRELEYFPGVTRHQLTVLEGLGYLSAPLGAPPALLPRLEDPHGTGPLEQRARAYLHGNCAGCHRPGGPRGALDWRFTTPLTATNACNAMPQFGDLGLGAAARIVAPGSPANSAASRRMHALDANRMPPVGSSVVDADGAALIDGWITSLTACP